MKHVFFIGSHTLFYTAISIKKYYKIKDKDILFITRLRYKNPLNNIKSISINSIVPVNEKDEEAMGIMGFFKPYTRSFYFLKIKKWIQHNIASSFYFYSNYFCTFTRLIAPQILCKEIRFIEEGMLCYGTHALAKKYFFKKYFARRFEVINLLSWGGLSIFQRQGDIPEQTTRKAYGFHEKSFSKSSGVQPVIIPFYKEKKIKITFKTPSPGSCIIVVGREESRFKYLPNNTVYFDAIETVWNKTLLYASKFKKIYIKFHPNAEETSVSYYKKIIKKLNIKPILIHADISLEQVFSLGKGYSVLGSQSSILFYARILNSSHRAISFDAFFDIHLKEKYKTFDYLAEINKEAFRSLFNKEVFYSLVEDASQLKFLNKANSNTRHYS